MMMNQAVTTGKPMFDKLGKTLSSKLGGKPASGPPQHLQSYQNYQSHHGPQGQQQTYQQQPAQTSQNYSSQPPQQPQWSQTQGTYIASNLQQASSPYPQSVYATPSPGLAAPNNYFPQQPHNHPGGLSQPHSAQPAENSGYTVPQQTYAGQYGQSQWGQGTPSSPPPQDQPFSGSYNEQQTGVIGGSHAPPPLPPHPQNISSPQPHIVSPITPEPQQHTGSFGSSQPFQLAQSLPSPPIQQSQSPQQWGPNNHNLGPNQHRPGSVSPPPPQTNMQAPPSKLLSQSSRPVPHQAPSPSPSEFIAELPADLGSLSIKESKPHEAIATPPSQYQAYSPSGPKAGSPAPGNVSSAGNVPLAEPWRFADPITEAPTREFFIFADLLFDALDRRFEPNCTGLLEAPKILASWVKLSDEARQLFSYNSYNALAKLWTLEGVPHVMVPCQFSLMPVWNFDQHSHVHDLKVPTQNLAQVGSGTTYMPALNRVGWYKFFFLETMHAPNDVHELMVKFCSDTYKPGVLQHPDFNKRDRSENTRLQARAGEIQTYAIARVCDETKLDMAADPDVPLGYNPPPLRAPGA